MLGRVQILLGAATRAAGPKGAGSEIYSRDLALAART